MRDFKRLAHAVWECKYHIVWCPKYRFQILKDEVAQHLDELIRQLCQWKGLVVLELNVQVDHVHLLLSLPPKYSVSEAVGFLKGKTAIKMFERHSQLRRRYWGRHFWARGYCVSTVGLDEEMIRKYVKWQLKKDQDSDDQLQLW